MSVDYEDMDQYDCEPDPLAVPEVVAAMAALRARAEKAEARIDDEQRWARERFENAMAQIAPGGRRYQLQLDDESPVPGMPMFGVIETRSPFLIDEKEDDHGFFDVYQWVYDEESFSCERQSVGLFITEDDLCKRDDAAEEALATALRERDAAIVRAETAEARDAWLKDVILRIAEAAKFKRGDAACMYDSDSSDLIGLVDGLRLIADEAFTEKRVALRERDEARAERDAAKRLNAMLMDVLLGIGAMFGLSIAETAEDPSLIVLRIEQSIGPNGPRTRRSR
jgi:hypothetical protein